MFRRRKRYVFKAVFISIYRQRVFYLYLSTVCMLKTYLENTGIFSEEEIGRVLPFFREVQLKRGDFFIREHEKCRKVAFVCSGIFRSFYSSGKGEDITYCFRFPGEFITAYTAFITGEQSQESMQAISDAVLLVISKEELDRLAEGNYAWTFFLKQTAEQQYMELEQRVFQLQRLNATERYRQLMNVHPGYIRNIPLQYLASYLGITQRHLSRIRREPGF